MDPAEKIARHASFTRSLLLILRILGLWFWSRGYGKTDSVYLERETGRIVCESEEKVVSVRL
jgi:hypothetical protein